MKRKLLALFLALLCVTTAVFAANPPDGDGNIGGEIFDDDPISLPWSLTVLQRQAGEKTHSVSVKVTGAERATVYLAAYGENGKMLALDVMNADLFTGTQTLPLAVACEETIDHVSVFVLDGNMLPRANAVTWENNGIQL